MDSSTAAASDGDGGSSSSLNVEHDTAAKTTGLDEFLLLLSVRVPNQTDVARIAGAMDKSNIRQENLVSLSVQSILEEITSNHTEVAAVMHTIADYFFGVEHSGMLVAPSEEPPVGLVAPSEQQQEQRQYKRRLRSQITGPCLTKQYRLLAASVASCGKGKAVVTCRASFNQNFDVNSYATFQAMCDEQTPEGYSVVDVWADKILQHLRENLAEAAELECENIVAWARNYFSNRKSYYRNFERVRQRSKQRYLEKKNGLDGDADANVDNDNDAGLMS